MLALREVLAAQNDDDFDLPAVVRRKPARKPQRKIGTGERVMSMALSRPRQILATLALAGCGGVIAWNALVLQSARHPAPLFSQVDVAAPAPPEAAAEEPAQPLPPTRPEAEADPRHAMIPVEAQPAPEAPAAAPVQPAPAAKPAARGPIADMIRNGGSPAPAPTKAAPQAPAPAPIAATPREKAPAVQDPIGDMIRMGGPVPVPPANVGHTDPGDTILAGQRALARLGYTVKVDGMMGAGTRQAIERFEQDRRLPVTGAFSARTVRELSGLSGIAVP
jgi:hypothetical protein